MLLLCSFCFFFKQKTAYELRISDWSSDVCSSDLTHRHRLADRGRPGDGACAGAFARHRANGERWQWIACRPALAVPADRRQGDRKSVVQGKRVSVRVDFGGRRIIKKKKSRNIST